MAETEVLRVEGLSAGYGPHEVLRGLDLTVRCGELWAILGPNGAGKSTLVRACLGLLPARRGTVRAFGQEVRLWSREDLARRAAWVPQGLELLPDFTALEVALMGRSPHLSRWALPARADVQRARDALAELGVGELAGRSMGALSGGERRLVMLARALVQSPELLLLDEPTAFLDVRHQVETLALVRRRVEAGMAVVAVLHDVNLAAAFATQVVLLSNGTALGHGPARDVLVPERLEALYGVPMMAASGASGQLLFAPRIS